MSFVALLPRVLWKIVFRFRGYAPQSVTVGSFWNWLRQYPWSARVDLVHLLDHVVYYSEKSTISSLVRMNEEILARLAEHGIGVEQVIYVSVDTAGSSSGVMLNLLRDRSNLERRRATFVDSKDAAGLMRATGRIQRGAIIYVDDFVGTGNQFGKNRARCGEYITGFFSEFMIAPVICEEGTEVIRGLGIEPVSDRRHTIDERPLHPDCTIFDRQRKKRLIEMCEEIDPRHALGYGGLANMVVFYKSAPNNTPLVLRGDLYQRKRVGLFPRFDERSEAATGK